MKRIVRLTESDLTRIVKRVIQENKLLTEQSYTRGSIVSFIVNKSHQITGLNTVGCQNTFIQFEEIDPKTKKLTGAAPLYYVVTRAGALDSFNKNDYRISDVNNSTNGTTVDNYNHQKMLGKIAKAAMISSGCK